MVCDGYASGDSAAISAVDANAVAPATMALASKVLYMVSPEHHSYALGLARSRPVQIMRKMEMLVYGMYIVSTRQTIYSLDIFTFHQELYEAKTAEY